MTEARTELKTSTRHCTDASTVDGPALDARYEAARKRDLELSERLGLEILEGL